jgi:transposase-like protein
VENAPSEENYMARQRKTFDPSLKLEVIRMIKDQGLSVQNVSETMDIGVTAIRRWLTQYSDEKNGQPGIGKPLTVEGNPTAAAGSGIDRPIRSRKPVCQRALPGSAQREWLRLQHEQEGQLLGARSLALGHNAIAERFFLNLKMERVRQRQYANQTEAKNDIADYIVSFYNCERLNSALGNLPPTVYERKMAAQKPIEVSEIT